ncbi:hypothetical protein [Actinomadura rubrisoli]|uniref:hypothetical protein n=1 Tax=Actinomadura rubrisoli TaxID=2530368 RepID=UPI001A9D7102|nr:hypothetical protein [Actinomadura rubrisoli]
MYPREPLEAFDAGGIDGAFVFAFALHHHPRRDGEGGPGGVLADVASVRRQRRGEAARRRHRSRSPGPCG